VFGPIRVPTVIVAVNFAKVPKKRPELCTQSIREHDGNRCQYTSRLLRPEEGSLDHVAPRSRAGRVRRSRIKSASSIRFSRTRCYCSSLRLRLNWSNCWNNFSKFRVPALELAIRSPNYSAKSARVFFRRMSRSNMARIAAGDQRWFSIRSSGNQRGRVDRNGPQSRLHPD
jgi:hypothetical protein